MWMGPLARWVQLSVDINGTVTLIIFFYSIGSSFYEFGCDSCSIATWIIQI